MGDRDAGRNPQSFPSAAAGKPFSSRAERSGSPFRRDSPREIGQSGPWNRQSPGEDRSGESRPTDSPREKAHPWPNPRRFLREKRSGRPCPTVSPEEGAKFGAEGDSDAREYRGICQTKRPDAYAAAPNSGALRRSGRPPAWAPRPPEGGRIAVERRRLLRRRVRRFSPAAAPPLNTCTAESTRIGSRRLGTRPGAARRR